MPTRCNRGFYCRSYCLLNMFRAPLCPSSGAQEYYAVVAACGISYCGFQVVALVWSWGLYVRFAGCCNILQTGHITLASRTKGPQFWSDLQMSLSLSLSLSLVARGMKLNHVVVCKENDAAITLEILGTDYSAKSGAGKTGAWYWCAPTPSSFCFFILTVASQRYAFLF